MSVETARQAAQEVLEVWDGQIGTHYQECWKRHVACFARFVLVELLDEEGRS